MNNKYTQVEKQRHHNLAVVESNSDKEIVCPECLSSNYKKAGFSRGKQRYKCQDCSRQFVITSFKKINIPKNFDFNNDVWKDEQIGLKRHLYRKRQSNYLNFSSIKIDWLKFNAKRFILYSASIRSWGTIGQYLIGFQSFYKFLEYIIFKGNIEDIDRELIIKYISYLAQQKLSSVTRGNRLSALSLLFETGSINNWFKIEPHLIRKEDYPKRDKTLPRYIPEEVIVQLNQNLHKLPEPIMRMVLVLQETGLRIGELCQLPFNCLKVDGKGEYQIQFMRWKLKTETLLPISQELAQVIKEQQEYIRESLGEKFQYLFCGRKTSLKFESEPKIISDQSFVDYLKRLAKKCQIKDNSGKLWNFQAHQFRHTVGTRMINAGVPHHIVQRYLGHESPTMTAVYAHIFDDTLRKEVEKYHESKVVNFQGQTVELDETILSSNDDLEWFKKNIQARALEHGYCARPKVLGDCDIPGFDGCYNCPHWRTNSNFLPILKDTLDRTNKIIEKARNCGWELQVKKNEPIQHNLETVIKSLEGEGNE